MCVVNRRPAPVGVAAGPRRRARHVRVTRQNVVRAFSGNADERLQRPRHVHGRARFAGRLRVRRAMER